MMMMITKMRMRMRMRIKNKKYLINKKRFFYQLDKLMYKNELLLV